MTVKQTRKTAVSAGPSALEKTGSPYGAAGLSALTEAQREMTQACGEIFGLAAQASKELAERQGAYFRANQEIFQSAFAAGRDGEPAERFARQGELYREFVETSVRHMSGMIETASNCCCDAVDRMTSVGVGFAAKASEKSSS